MAPFLDDEMRVYSPVVYRGNKKRRPFNRKYEYYWIVRVSINYLLIAGRNSDFVLGVAVVTDQGIKLSAFTSQFALASQVDRSSASAAYQFFAAKAYDEEMGDIWVAKITQEQLNDL